MNPLSRRILARAALAALAVVMGAMVPAFVPAAAAWSEFGTPEEKPAPAPAGPEIREPFFAFLVTLAAADSLGTWSTADLAAFAAATGLPSRFPLDEVVAVSRTRPDSLRAGRYGVPIRAVWRVQLSADQDRPMPYSILGYHPGSLRISGVLELAELAAMEPLLDLPASGGEPRRRQRVTEFRVFALERGHVVLDADGWLDALLGAGLDDSWTLGFVTGRVDDVLIGLGVSLGRDGRRIYGEFDFRNDQVLAHGRPLANAMSRTSRTWLDVEAGNLPDPWVE